MARLKASDIKSVAIYPPIGLARVGNAAGDDEFMLASEVIGGLPDTRGGFRAGDGRIKRQAIRFRIYATLRDGSVVEVTAASGAKIAWRVEIANIKAGWYSFLQAMDLPEELSKPAPRRNANEQDRDALDIRPSPRTITGRNLSGQGFMFDDGTFFGKPVYLGELRTDEEGRLIFLGGRGTSEPKLTGTHPTTFANNELWHDDVSDGTVRATVTIDERSFEAEPGYVTVAPPNFAPGLFGVVTMDDVLRDLFISEGMLPTPTTTSFTRDIWPIFDRMTGLGWVNHGAFVTHGMGSPLNARDPAVIARLTDASPHAADWRAAVVSLFLTPEHIGGVDHARLPQVFGDAYGEDDKGFKWKLERLAVKPTMYEHLKRWRDGAFDSDWPGAPPVPISFASLSAEEQIEHLNRAALHECLGGPFHPGIELTWTLRHRAMWKAPYRLKLLAEGERTRQDFGGTLTPEVCLSGDGPLSAVGPGALTRWLGVPWQTDEASCNSEAEYSPSLYLSMPTFWGARVPDQVLSQEAWNRASAVGASDAQRLKHFFFREDWLRDIRGTGYLNRIANIVDEWWRLGLVTPRETELEMQALGLPAQVHVESERPMEIVGSNEKIKLIAAVEALAGAGAPAAGVQPDTAPPTPPRRSYKRGEV
ncbi:LodA/GoxA family CTQ-dependent oxidase [Pseudomonas sp. NPDC087336]|uniref:LodA/GoxA family CTQ-dependent oxidase n=1 Tax=Pseudomonas sp. NPDC087336 TaxID=3364436 RepID=UPI003819168C